MSQLMSPFFKPEPRRSLCFEYYKATIYTLLFSFAIASIITLPWLLELTRDILTESTPRHQPLPTETMVYVTVAVIIVIYAAVLAVGAFAIYSER